MKRMTLLLVVGLLFASGCARDPYRRFRLGPAGPVVRRCIDMMGGLERWQSVKPIRAKALVTMYDDEGRGTVTEQDQVVDLCGGEIQASAELPEGRWTAKVYNDGKWKFKAEGLTVTEEMRARIISALRVSLHRLRGSLNLCGRDERPVDVGPGRLAGEELTRVPVEGGRQGVAAYYFDAQTSMLRFVTAGADAPGGEGTVTTYTYQIAPNGMAFPSRMSVVKIGEHVLIGHEPVLEVTYRQVRF